MDKIAIVRYNLSKIGGAEKVSINLANELSNYYHVSLISILLNEDKKINYEIDENVKLVSFFSGDKKVREVTLKAAKVLRRYLKEQGIKVVYSIAPSTNAIVFLATLGMNVKIIFCDHHSLEFQDGVSRKIQRYIGAKFFDQIVTLTEEDKNKYPILYKINKEKVRNIYNWIEDISEKPHKYDVNSKKIVTVGRFDVQKGYDYLSKVAVSVLSSNPDWSWDIYGSGDEKIKRSLCMELSKAGVESQVSFKGNVKGTENIYPNHAMYVMTSRYEGLPLVLLEAKQYGLPVISFNCPTGPSEIVVEGENGFLIKNFDIRDMSDKINSLIKNEDLRMEFSRNSMKNTEKFKKEKILKQWINLTEEMIGGEDAR